MNFKKIFFPLIMLTTISYMCTAQMGCLVADGSGGQRLFFVLHPDGNPAHYTSTGSNTNYIVLNTGPYNCTNYNGSTFATNIGSGSTACTVLQNTGQVTYNNGTIINGYSVYQCSVDGYLYLFGTLLGLLGFLTLRRHLLQLSLGNPAIYG